MGKAARRVSREECLEGLCQQAWSGGRPPWRGIISGTNLTDRKDGGRLLLRQKHSIKYRGPEVGIKLDLFEELKYGWCGQGLVSDVESEVVESLRPVVQGKVWMSWFGLLETKCHRQGRRKAETLSF